MKLTSEQDLARRAAYAGAWALVWLLVGCAYDAQAVRTVSARIPDPPAAEAGNSRRLEGRDFTLYALDDTARRITCYVHATPTSAPLACAAWPDHGRTR